MFAFIGDYCSLVDYLRFHFEILPGPGGPGIIGGIIGPGRNPIGGTINESMIKNNITLENSLHFHFCTCVPGGGIPYGIPIGGIPGGP
jgi:hypothetical protein